MEDFMIIAIDFDGTIVEHDYPRIGKIRENARVSINMLKALGNTVIIWTCRYKKRDLYNMISWLQENNISYDYVNCNHPGIDFYPEPKIYADIYIDDRQVGGLPSWEQIYKIITGNELLAKRSVL
jgi:hydroxymethylpyrimidine pyrophosphatase-like HAD family hydrolase